MSGVTWVVIAIIAVALLFDYINGFHDAANSIATVVSTRVLTPKQAVTWAAFFNFAAFIFFGTKVAETISQVAAEGTFNNAAIFAALMGAIAWDLITWWTGLPTSSSHALVGGLAGAAVAKVGWSALNNAE
jgi:PiT family inorganic phosphate transporter